MVQQRRRKTRKERQRSRHEQVGAICYRRVGGRLRILLVTSLTTRRWVIPKGWPMEDHSLSEAAAIEAFQEAGVVGIMSEESLGHYKYVKDRGRKNETRCRVHVFPLEVTRIFNHFDEKGRRRRKWVSVKEARRRVREPGLKRIFADFDPD